MTEVPAETPGPALVCPGCGSPDVDLERGLLCGECAANPDDDIIKDADSLADWGIIAEGEIPSD